MLVSIAQFCIIRKIVNDETWYEGERRGRPVDPHDPVVSDHVADVIQRIGEQMRRTTLEHLRQEIGFATKEDRVCHGCSFLSPELCGCRRCARMGEVVSPDDRPEVCIESGLKE